MCLNFGKIEEAWKHLEHLLKRNTDLAEPEDDFVTEDTVNLGIIFRNSGHFCKAKELFLDAFRQDRNTSQAKKLKFTLDFTIEEMNQAGKFFSEEVIWKAAAQIL